MWIVRSLGAPNLAERMEADLIQSFVDRIAEFRPQLVISKQERHDCGRWLKEHGHALPSRSDLR